MEVIVDVQGFKSSGNRFVFKEIAVLYITDGSVTSFLVQPPFPWTHLPARCKSENSWLTRNLHGLSWDSGTIRYSDFHPVLRSILTTAVRIYVKGLEKMRWLQEEYPDLSFVNFEDLECPNLLNLKTLSEVPTCCDHSYISNLTTPNCAIQNVRLLYSWYCEHIM